MRVRHNPFAPVREDIWGQVTDADRIPDEEQVAEGFWKHDVVRVEAGEWVVTFDQGITRAQNSSYDQKYTRIRAPYANRDGFRFCIYRDSHGLLSNLGRLLGMQDIEVGYSDFDADFIIKGNDEAQLRALFANAKLRHLVSAQQSFRLQVKKDEGWFGPRFPDGVDELYFATPEWVVHIEEIRALFDLFSEALNQLCHIGSAYEDDPQLVI